jgi:protein tyrosine/serine phosphatase
LPEFNLTTPAGRLAAYVDYNLNDHAFLRLGFSNAHWLGDKMVRTSQLWPHQLRWWRDRAGIRTVVNLRGGFDASFYALEKDACDRLGLNLVNFTMRSRAVPSRDQILGAKRLFETIEYPALMHCKSGADRASVMSALYAHFQLGQPIEQAMQQLSFRYLHMKSSKTGVLDRLFETYLAEGEPAGLSFLAWVESPAYDPDAIAAGFKPSWWGHAMTDWLLRRE